MRMVIYADILFIVNLYTDALLLSAVRRFLRLPLSVGRLLLSSALGGALGLLGLVPLPFAALRLLIGLFGAALLTFAAFCPMGKGTFIKAAFLLLLFGAALSGLVFILPIPGAALVGGAVYFDISAVTLIACTTAAYLALWVFDRLFRKRAPDALFCRVQLTLGEKEVRLTAKIDTGMTLSEPFSGLPVLVAHRRAVEKLLPADFGTPAGKLPLRLVPFSALGADGLLPAFRPDGCLLDESPADLWIAVSERPLSGGSFNALVPPGAAGPKQQMKGWVSHGSSHDASKQTAPSDRALSAASERRHLPLHKRTGNTPAAPDKGGGAARAE